MFNVVRKPEKMQTNKKYAVMAAFALCGTCIFLYNSSLQHNYAAILGAACVTTSIGATELNMNMKSVGANRYAVFACNTPPADPKSRRQYDYAFYLPLTVLAWDRIGFKSIVIIIGDRDEWRANPPLWHILVHLEATKAEIIFLNASVDNAVMLSQTSRIFVANMNQFAGKTQDFIMTTDSDLWPLREAHYAPEPPKKLVLVHSHCCGNFVFKNQSYRMIPMSNIGATAATWRQILNDHRTTANDAESILNYYQQDFGDQVRREVIYASADWFLDQKMISVRVQQWIDAHSSDLVLEKSDTGLSRVDRPNWHPENIDQSSLGNYYDAHLPVFGYQPHTWKTIRPLIRLMFNDSWQVEWSESYTAGFHFKYVETAN